ncbi:MAG: hypothetical protein NZM11_01420, partial [Anaerolineales bacterium]|nr:hypothetical protein [Anaerolineales bacterium]
EEVERRLAAYTSPETDPRAAAEMLNIIRSGMTDPDAPLPEVLPPVVPRAASSVQDRRAARRRAREVGVED